MPMVTFPVVRPAIPRNIYKALEQHTCTLGIGAAELLRKLILAELGPGDGAVTVSRHYRRQEIWYGERLGISYCVVDAGCKRQTIR